VTLRCRPTYLLEQLRVERAEGDQPRTTPETLRADKAYSFQGNRALLRARRIKTVIPIKADQAASRKRKGSDDHRPPVFDADDYRNRNVIERGLSLYNNGATA
jgi:hypothetical protein